MKKTFILFIMLSVLLVAAGINAETIPTKGYVTPDIGLNVRSGPSEGSTKIGALEKGTVLKITSVSGKWYKISSPMSGYVHGDYVTVTDSIESEDPTDEQQPGQESKVDDSTLPQEEQEKIGCDIDRSLANVQIIKTPIK
ncbi:MAG: SH3 domain-containing protein [Candidatus Riflebacteria bacterium]|nr:SH3 domain-containing protein [Candidatus Riflebacteria bacterium]